MTYRMCLVLIKICFFDNSWKVTMKHTLREGNAIADLMAKTGAKSHIPFTLLRNCPSNLELVLPADTIDIHYVRL